MNKSFIIYGMVPGGKTHLNIHLIIVNSKKVYDTGP
jgi:hypothetical protein